MSYIIDGHNLIPKVYGLQLSMLNDEEALISMLQDFCRVHRKKVEVYFDQAAAGHVGKKRYGQVMVHFVQSESTADAAIISKLRKLKKGARNITVVSSDHQIIAEAKSMGAVSLRSENFAEMMMENRKQKQEEAGPLLTSEEVEEWMNIFDGKDDRK